MNEVISPAALPPAVRITGRVAVWLATILATRLVWEQTMLTWEDGPQMVGFMLAHSPALPLLFAPWGLLVWTAALLITGIRQAWRRVFVRSTWLDLAVSLLVWGVLSIPYATWQWLFIDRLAPGPHAADFLTEAAAIGDVRLVEGLVARGVSPNENSGGTTAVHAAALRNQVKVLEFLAARGASLNAINDFGDSPLEVASANGSMDAARFLEAHGAERIKGTPAQRTKAIEAMMRRARP